MVLVYKALAIRVWGVGHWALVWLCGLGVGLSKASAVIGNWFGCAVRQSGLGQTSRPDCQIRKSLRHDGGLALPLSLGVEPSRASTVIGHWERKNDKSTLPITHFPCPMPYSLKTSFL